MMREPLGSVLPTHFNPLDEDQRRVRDKLLGDPSFRGRLKAVFEAYDFDADPDKAADALIDTVARYGGLRPLRPTL